MHAMDFDETSTIWGVFVGNRGCELPTFSSPNNIFPPEKGTEGYVAIGWAEVGSMKLYENNYNDFIAKYRIVYAQSRSTEGALKTQANMVWNFAFEMKEGDIIITPSSSTGYVLIGKVISEYISNFDDHLNLHKSAKERTNFFHLRKVEWLYVINSEDDRYSKLNKIGQLTVVKSSLSVHVLKSILEMEGLMDTQTSEDKTLKFSADKISFMVIAQVQSEDGWGASIQGVGNEPIYIFHDTPNDRIIAFVGDDLSTMKIFEGEIISEIIELYLTNCDTVSDFNTISGKEIDKNYLIKLMSFALNGDSSICADENMEVIILDGEDLENEELLSEYINCYGIWVLEDDNSDISFDSKNNCLMINGSEIDYIPSIFDELHGNASSRALFLTNEE
jgi:hypothetical protein